ncbi:MAG: DedA family protein [Bacteroidota bacterium]
MDSIIETLLAMNPLWVYCGVALIAYLENLFPPFPSDVAIVASASLIGFGTIDFLPLLVVSTIGSTLGFVTMYRIGDWFGDKILEMGKIPFIPIENVHKVESWFRKYGYWLIIANRFLAGTRAVVSFFAGMSELNLWKTTALSFGSALMWNTILILAGKALGDNWSSIALYLETYSKGVTLVVLLIIALVVVARYFYKNTQAQRSSSKDKGANP